MSHLLSEMKSQVAKQAFPSVTDAFGQSALVAIVWLKKPASSLTMLISIKVVTSKNEFAFVRTTHRNRWFQCEATLRTFTIHECSSLDLTSMTWRRSSIRIGRIHATFCCKSRQHRFCRSNLLVRGWRPHNPYRSINWVSEQMIQLGTSCRRRIHVSRLISQRTQTLWFTSILWVSTCNVHARGWSCVQTVWSHHRKHIGVPPRTRYRKSRCHKITGLCQQLCPEQVLMYEMPPHRSYVYPYSSFS